VCWRVLHTFGLRMLFGVPPPPLNELKDGPAAGYIRVFPDINGELPKFIAVAEHRTDGRRLEHVYTRIPSRTILNFGFAASRYRYVRTIDNEHPRYMCPRCGMTSYNANDIEQGYCGACHDWTRIRRYAVIEAAADVELPPEWAGRWFDQEIVASLLKIHNLAGHPTGTYLRGAAGAYAEILQAHRADAAASADAPDE
jgi:ribosomal protein L37E